MKILTILGARPQFIKAASVSRVISAHSDINEIIVHTGQHYDTNMSDVFFEELVIPKPDYFLGVGGKSHGAMTGQMIEKIEEVAFEVKPDWMLVYGDTNSTLAGAIVASKLRIRLAHVEAGLRSFNMNMPEEINRILTDRVSDILFCPTENAVQNLMNEGYGNIGSRIVKNGDVMKDGAIFYRKLARKPMCDIEDDFILCTVHRAENTDDPARLESIFAALGHVSESRQVILPLHPRTRKKLADLGLCTGNIKIIDPVGYLEMVWLISNCSYVVTDSGGLQKEAYFFGKYCVTLRDETEWVELVQAGVNTLAGSGKDSIISACSCVKEFSESSALYGDGSASEIIVRELSEYK